MKAKKCYTRAMNVGDQEDIAMIRLARVCEALHDEQEAVRYETGQLDGLQGSGTGDRKDS